MFTLAYPITLPGGRAFHMDARAMVPPIGDGLRMSCLAYDPKFPQIILVQGFCDSDTAVAFAQTLGEALQCASLALAHGFKLPERAVEISDIAVYDGHTPTVFKTALRAKPAFASASFTSIDHLRSLALQIDHEIEGGAVEKTRAWPELALAVRLFAEAEFAGGETAKFIVFFSALEVMITHEGAKKRNHVLKLVGDALRAVERQDAKAVCKQLDKLYTVRNALVHEAAAVSSSQVQELAVIVRDTLRILTEVSGPAASPRLIA